MDAETAILLGGAFAVSVAVAIQHFYDRFHPRGLYKSAVQRTAALPSAIGTEVENALNRVSASQQALYEAEAAKAQAEVAKNPGGQTWKGDSAHMAMVSSVAGDARTQAKATRLMAEGLLGQWLPAIRVVLPSVAEQLEEDPELIFSIIENPFFKKHIAPRLQGLVGAATTGGGGIPSDNPFLSRLRP